MDKNKQSNVIPFANKKVPYNKTSTSTRFTDKQPEVGHHRQQAYEQLLKNK